MLKKKFFSSFIQSFVLVLIQVWEQGPTFQLQLGRPFLGCPSSWLPFSGLTGHFGNGGRQSKQEPGSTGAARWHQHTPSGCQAEAEGLQEDEGSLFSGPISEPLEPSTPA